MPKIITFNRSDGSGKKGKITLLEDNFFLIHGLDNPQWKMKKEKMSWGFNIRMINTQTKKEIAGYLENDSNLYVFSRWGITRKNENAYIAFGQLLYNLI